MLIFSGNVHRGRAQKHCTTSVPPVNADVAHSGQVENIHSPGQDFPDLAAGVRGRTSRGCQNPQGPSLTLLVLGTSWCIVARSRPWPPDVLPGIRRNPIRRDPRPPGKFLRVSQVQRGRPKRLGPGGPTIKLSFQSHSMHDRSEIDDKGQTGILL